MEVIKFDVETRELSRELLTEGFTQKIDCTRYWDAHGKRSECEPEQHKFDRPKKFEIWKVCSEEFYPSINLNYQQEYWRLFIDGKELDLGEIMSYRVLKTKLKLDICVGAG